MSMYQFNLRLNDMQARLERAEAEITDLHAKLFPAVSNGGVETVVRKGPGGKWFTYQHDRIVGRGHQSYEDAVASLSPEFATEPVSAAV